MKRMLHFLPRHHNQLSVLDIYRPYEISAGPLNSFEQRNWSGVYVDCVCDHTRNYGLHQSHCPCHGKKRSIPSCQLCQKFVNGGHQLSIFDSIYKNRNPKVRKWEGSFSEINLSNDFFEMPSCNIYRVYKIFVQVKDRAISIRVFSEDLFQRANIRHLTGAEYQYLICLHDMRWNIIVFGGFYELKTSIRNQFGDHYAEDTFCQAEKNGRQGIPLPHLSGA